MAYLGKEHWQKEQGVQKAVRQEFEEQQGDVVRLRQNEPGESSGEGAESWRWEVLGQSKDFGPTENERALNIAVTWFDFTVSKETLSLQYGQPFAVGKGFSDFEIKGVAKYLLKLDSTNTNALLTGPEDNMKK